MQALILAAVLAATGPFDHSAFDALLRQHVVEGLVDYDAFRRAPAFSAYLDRLARADSGPMQQNARRGRR